MNKLVAVIGPTGIGKTKTALQLARKLQVEIVNADSRQLYHYMNIGTAKPTQIELDSIPYHLIDFIDPNNIFSLSDYQKLAYEAITEIQSRRKIPLLVGGTGQYIWAVIEGWVIPKVAPDPKFRRDLERQAAQGRAIELYQELRRLDPVSAVKIDPRNVRRVIRALEVRKHGIENLAAFRHKQSPPFDISIIGLTISRKELYHRVDARVEVMIRLGFVDEVKYLLEKGYDLDLPAMSGIGYREIAQYLSGKITLEKAVYNIKTRTHRFIRAQYTWFRLEDERIKWFDIEQIDYAEIENWVEKCIHDY